MKILGVNKGQTCAGKPLRHGGAALYVDGKVSAVAEERITGKKYAAGYERSAEAILRESGKRFDDLDAIAVSTCCESEVMAASGHPLAWDETTLPKIETVNHHLSHGALAFYASGFEEALVVVMDDGGNILFSEGEVDESQWWTFPREQHSYYIGNRSTGLELIGRDFDEPLDAGFGEIYRAFTYYLGWHSSTSSSKTMALASHGRRGAISADFINFEDGRLTSALVNNPLRPLEMIGSLSRRLGVDFGEPRPPNGPILQIHRDVAAFLQREVERALLRKIDYLRSRHHVDDLCLSGGFALNVAANGSLLREMQGEVYVPSAPGDDGQCLGNVLALAASSRASGVSMPPMRRSSDVLLGPARQLDSKSLVAALASNSREEFLVYETSDLPAMLARILASGSVVCLYDDRSEFGPRALGSRSILADPRLSDAVSTLSSLKNREWFVPFAAAILEEHLSDWFDLSVESPFMSFAIPAKTDTVAELPAVANLDGTATVQTVGYGDDAALRPILLAFAKRTGVPMLLNTSFNLGGRPMVETLEQAVESFSQMSVNVMGVAGRFVVVKSLSPDLGDFPVASSLTNMTMEVLGDRSATPVDVHSVHLSEIIRRLQNLTDAIVFVRTELPLYGRYLERLREGRKVTTIRFRKGAVEMPCSSVLPLFKTVDSNSGDEPKPTEQVSIAALRYQRFGELSIEDAHRDGIEDLADMQRNLKKIYPDISDRDWVTIYDVTPQSSP